MTMGSVSRTDRCTRFIREFGTDYVHKLGLGIGRRLIVVAEGLAFDKRDEVVRYEVVVRPEGTEEEIRFMLDPVFFAPEDVTKDKIDQVADDLERDPEAVRRRFGAAGLSGRRR
jgi:hypothetical protein